MISVIFGMGHHLPDIKALFVVVDDSGNPIFVAAHVEYGVTIDIIHRVEGSPQFGEGRYRDLPHFAVPFFQSGLGLRVTLPEFTDWSFRNDAHGSNDDGWYLRNGGLRCR